MVAGIEDAGGDDGLVALTDEAGHVGLYHHVLLGYCLAAEHAMTQIGGVGQSHEAPGGKALGQGELQGNHAVGICHQLWIEEGRLVEVLT